MLTPERLPQYAKDKCCVVHRFPDEWDEQEVSQHRYDECPCAPQMDQMVGGGYSYHWLVTHRRIPRTEEIPL